MAKKITAIVAGVCGALVGISYLFMDSTGFPAGVGLVLWVVGVIIGIFSLIALAVLALIDYARRPRKEG